MHLQQQQLVSSALTCSLAASLAYLTPVQLAAARKEWRHTGPFTADAVGSEYAGRLAADFTFAEQIQVPLQASATIFESVDSDELCVAFRGSTGAENFKSMFALNLVPLDGNDASAKVHSGYQTASLQLYEKLMPALERRGAARVVFTGHSYGGGTATLCALYHEPDRLLTFSAPLVGDVDFASKFDAALSGEERVVHLVHDADPVLQQNRPLWDALGYVHTGRVVRCSPDSPLLYNDDDEPGSAIAWNFADHCRYLGTYLGPRAETIKWRRLLKPNFRPS